MKKSVMLALALVLLLSGCAWLTAQHQAACADPQKVAAIQQTIKAVLTVGQIGYEVVVAAAQTKADPTVTKVMSEIDTNLDMIGKLTDLACPDRNAEQRAQAALEMIMRAKQELGTAPMAAPST